MACGAASMLKHGVRYHLRDQEPGSTCQGCWQLLHVKNQLIGLNQSGESSKALKKLGTHWMPAPHPLTFPKEVATPASVACSAVSSSATSAATSTACHVESDPPRRAAGYICGITSTPCPSLHLFIDTLTFKYLFVARTLLRASLQKTTLIDLNWLLLLHIFSRISGCLHGCVDSVPHVTSHVLVELMRTNKWYCASTATSSWSSPMAMFSSISFSAATA